MNLVELLVFLALCSGLTSVWLGHLPGVSWLILVVPVFVAEFYLLRAGWGWWHGSDRSERSAKRDRH